MAFKQRSHDFTIALNGSLSGAMHIDEDVVGFLMPSAFTGTTLTFQMASATMGSLGAVAQGTFANVYDDAGNELSVTVAVDRFVKLVGNKLDALRGVGFLKIRSGTSGSPTTETAARTVTAISQRRFA